MKFYTILIHDYQLEEMNITIQEYTRQAEHLFNEEGTPEEGENYPFLNYIDTVKGVDIYKNIATDSYHFAHNEDEPEETPQKDLFKYYEEQPQELKEVLKPYEEHNPTYESLQKILKEVEAIGYTFDYGLDANPYNLRKM